MNGKELSKSIDSTAKVALSISGGWLVGGSIRDLIGGSDPKDYDIVVSDRELFQMATLYLKSKMGDPQISTPGGLKFSNEGLEIDIWCEELSHFLANAIKFDYLYNHRKRTLIKKVD